MNKQYMDFVPAKGKKTGKPAKKTAIKKPANLRPAPVVNTEKRVQSSVNEAKKAKSQVIRARATQKTEERTVVRSRVAKEKNTFVPPKATFINQEKVVKRPLSKNTYQKRVEESLKNSPKEEPQGPVTIISKPEKDAKVGVIITIIITIILGAAAGTVAFLLLPK